MGAYVYERVVLWGRMFIIGEYCGGSMFIIGEYCGGVCL